MVLLMHLFVRMQRAPQTRQPLVAPTASASDNMVDELMASLDAFDNGMARDVVAHQPTTRNSMEEVQEEAGEAFKFASLSIRAF